MADDNGDASGDAQTPVEPAAEPTPTPEPKPEPRQTASDDDDPIRDQKLKDLSDEAKRHRLKAKSEREANEKLTAELEAERKRVKQIEELLGIDSKGEDGPDPLEVAKAKVEKAQRALIRSSFTEAALKAGIRDDRIGAAWKLAQDDLSEVTVDLDEGTASGVDEVAQRVAKDMPELTQKQGSPKVDSRKSGGPKGPSIDLSAVERGQFRKLYRENPDEFFKLVEEGLEFVTDYTDPDGNPIKIPVTAGGSRLDHEIRAVRARAQKRREVDLGG